MSTPPRWNYNLPSPLPPEWTATPEASMHLENVLHFQAHARKAAAAYLSGKKRGLQEATLNRRWRTAKRTRAMFEGALTHLECITNVYTDPSVLLYGDTNV